LGVDVDSFSHVIKLRLEQVPVFYTGFKHSIQAVEGCNSVPLGIGRVIEDMVYKVSDVSVQGHDRLSDVDQIAGSLPNDVDAQKLQSLCVEHYFEESVFVVRNASFCQITVIGTAYRIVYTRR